MPCHFLWHICVIVSCWSVLFLNIFEEGTQLGPMTCLNEAVPLVWNGSWLSTFDHLGRHAGSPRHRFLGSQFLKQHPLRREHLWVGRYSVASMFAGFAFSEDIAREWSSIWQEGIRKMLPVFWEQGAATLLVTPKANSPRFEEFWRKWGWRNEGEESRAWAPCNLPTFPSLQGPADTASLCIWVWSLFYGDNATCTGHGVAKKQDLIHQMELGVHLICEQMKPLWKNPLRRASALTLPSTGLPGKALMSLRACVSLTEHSPFPALLVPGVNTVSLSEQTEWCWASPPILEDQGT